MVDMSYNIGDVLFFQDRWTFSGHKTHSILSNDIGLTTKQPFTRTYIHWYYILHWFYKVNSTLRTCTCKFIFLSLSTSCKRATLSALLWVHLRHLYHAMSAKDIAVVPAAQRRGRGPLSCQRVEKDFVACRTQADGKPSTRDTNAGSMMRQRRRRWRIIDPTLAQRGIFRKKLYWEGTKAIMRLRRRCAPPCIMFSDIALSRNNGCNEPPGFTTFRPRV